MKLSFRLLCLSCISLALLGWSLTSAYSRYQTGTAVAAVTTSAETLLDSLTAEQAEVAILDYDSPQRIDWHFIPMETRKGLKMREMSDDQQRQALTLLQNCLSAAGYQKARSIMSLEKLLYSLESVGTRERRDPLKYYFTFFGDPRSSEKWGLSFEGHHLSLNFVFDNDQMISSTPQFFATNPAVMQTKNEVGFELGSQVLKTEQELAFELINSLSDDLRKTAIIDPKAPKEIRNADKPHPPQEPPAGLPAGLMTAPQQKMLRQLIAEYAQAIPANVAALRLEEMEAAGFKQVRFAWAGATEPGIGHYYRIQGPTFLIEFVNTQPDAAGNPANHIHCVWRDMDGDFALSARQ